MHGSLLKVLRWINPAVKVKVGDEESNNFRPGIGLKCSTVNEWQDISTREIKNFLKSVGYSTVEVSMAFAKDDSGQCSVQDLSGRCQEKSKMAKGLKIPEEFLNKDLLDLIKMVTTSDEDTFPKKAEDLLSEESLLEREISALTSSKVELSKNVHTSLTRVDTELRKLLKDKQKIGPKSVTTTGTVTHATTEALRMLHTPASEPLTGAIVGLQVSNAPISNPSTKEMFLPRMSPDANETATAVTPLTENYNKQHSAKRALQLEPSDSHEAESNGDREAATNRKRRRTAEDAQHRHLPEGSQSCAE